MGLIIVSEIWDIIGEVGWEVLAVLETADIDEVVVFEENGRDDVSRGLWQRRVDSEAYKVELVVLVLVDGDGESLYIAVRGLFDGWSLAEDHACAFDLCVSELHEDFNGGVEIVFYDSDFDFGHDVSQGIVFVSGC